MTPLIAEDKPRGALELLNSGQSGRRLHGEDLERTGTLGDSSLALRRARLMEEEGSERTRRRRSPKQSGRTSSEIPPLLQVCADRDRILQVFGNLIGNAIKFTPEGGTITVSAFQRGDDVVFQVRDTGPRIPESDLKHALTPYWQAKKTAHMAAGLGLAIVRGIIEAHGGTVSASTAVGGGALFTFTIPKA